MSDLSLNSNDYFAIARALDKNKNNKIDNSEANVNYAANMMIGNANSVTGTRELAESLERGDVVLTGLSQESADKIADYFSDRGINEKKPVENWKGDGWVSKADLTVSDRARKLIDINNDNRISSREFAQALRSGVVSIGGNNTVADQNDTPVQTPVSNNPFSSGKPSVPTNSGDPFSSGKPSTPTNSNDPFASKPVNTPSKPATNNDPFSSGNTAPRPTTNNDPFSSSKPASTGKTSSSDPFSSGANSSGKPASNSDPFSSKR